MCASRLVWLRALDDARILLYFSGNSGFSAAAFCDLIVSNVWNNVVSVFHSSRSLFWITSLRYFPSVYSSHGGRCLPQ